MYSGKQTSFFQSYCGVRLGENLSPVLFSLFLNDIEDYLRSSRCSRIKLDSSDYDIEVYLQILVLFYAGDTVMFGTDEKTVHANFDAFYEYCEVWKLNINFNKTKIMIFGIRNTDNFQFYIGQDTISKCHEFKYLGVIFSITRSFYKAIKHNVEHTKKALHLLYKRINNSLINAAVRPHDITNFDLWLWDLGFPKYKHYEVSKEHTAVYALRWTRKGANRSTH